MERTITTEERIRRAEAIYEKRRQGSIRPVAMVNVNDKEKKDIKLLKKMIIQVLICVAIYLLIYTVQNNEYVFSKDFTNKLNELLAYDTNFIEIYNNIKENLKGLISNNKAQVEEQTNTQGENQEQSNEQQENSEGQENSNTEANTEMNAEIAIGGSDEAIQNIEETKTLTPEEQEIEKIKSTTSFIKPVEGFITSAFGQRESTSIIISKNHTGTDIAANLGTKIKSSTEGEVVLVSEEGAYGKHIKVQIGEVSIIYAHCNKIYVNQGDKLTQGQEIAEVGSTGNSTRTTLTF